MRSCRYASKRSPVLERGIGDLGRSIDRQLGEVNAVVNLAGRTVNCIKTPDHQDEILRSRVESTREAMRAVDSPPPVWVQMFMRTLRSVIGMPIGLPAFEWMVRIGAPLFMRTDPELVLYGRDVIAKRLMDEGLEFRFAELEPALRDLLK